MELALWCHRKNSHHFAKWGHNNRWNDLGGDIIAYWRCSWFINLRLHSKPFWTKDSTALQYHSGHNILASYLFCSEYSFSVCWAIHGRIFRCTISYNLNNIVIGNSQRSVSIKHFVNKKKWRNSNHFFWVYLQSAWYFIVIAVLFWIFWHLVGLRNWKFQFRRNRNIFGCANGRLLRFVFLLPRIPVVFGQTEKNSRK